jgi:hypothetical protein
VVAKFPCWEFDRSVGLPILGRPCLSEGRHTAKVVRLARAANPTCG